MNKLNKETLKYTKLKRIIAGMCDFITVMGVSIVINIVRNIIFKNDINSASYVDYMFTALIMFTMSTIWYIYIPLKNNNRTIYKILFGLYVVDENNRIIPFDIYIKRTKIVHWFYYQSVITFGIAIKDMFLISNPIINAISAILGLIAFTWMIVQFIISLLIKNNQSFYDKKYGTQVIFSVDKVING